MYTRDKTKAIKISDNLQIGGNNDIVIQSMLTTRAKDHEKCLKEIHELAAIGCQIIRLAVFDSEDVEALKIICKESPIPIVSDIQFNYVHAIKSVENGVRKIRINPGNMSKDHIKKVVDCCKKHKIPIRIGVNSGSLEVDLLNQYGVTGMSIFKSAQRNIELLEAEDFYDIIVSVKASDPEVAIEAYRLMAQHYSYPLHLGITEAGSLLRATIKSSLALGKLIEEGIGSTIRVSITDDCKKEVLVAKEILRYFGIKKNLPNLISCPTCGRLRYDMFPLVKEIETFLETKTGAINVAIMGCSVNGPGESKNADIALCGDINQADLYIDGKYSKTISNNDLANEFKKEIDRYLENIKK